MTICIAASCDSRRNSEAKLIVAFDWKVSTVIGTAETKHKLTHLPNGWSCLCAGNEAEAIALVSLLRQQFGGEGRIINETNVVQLFRNALNLRKKEKADELVQGRYALSYDDFLKTGKEKLPTDIYRDTIAEIGIMTLRADCIIVGFIAGDTYIIETDSKGHVSIVEDFAAIGEGAYLAQSALLHRGHIDSSQLSASLYRVFEAKKYAERVSSVGTYTSLQVFYGDRTVKRITKSGLDFLLEKYKRFGPQQVLQFELSDDALEDF
jgi:20S proteasome alpha/beta subunit